MISLGPEGAWTPPLRYIRRSWRRILIGRVSIYNIKKPPTASTGPRRIKRYILISIFSISSQYLCYCHHGSVGRLNVDRLVRSKQYSGVAMPESRCMGCLHFTTWLVNTTSSVWTVRRTLLGVRHNPRLARVLAMTACQKACDSRIGQSRNILPLKCDFVTYGAWH